MRTFIVTARGRRRTTDTWEEIYEILCDLHGIDPRFINEERHTAFAHAESWCELLCGEGGPYLGNGFSIEVCEDYELLSES